MSKLLDSIKATAVSLNKHIVLPEGEEPRIIRAAVIITAEKLARVTLLGDIAVMKDKCPEVSFEGINVINPKSSDKKEEYTDILFELRKAKGLTREQAEDLVVNNTLFYGALMVKNGDADGMVAGAINSTGNVLRAGLQVVKTAKGINTVSSIFILSLAEGCPYGENGIMIFGDCGVNPAPTMEQLADIAIASAESAKKIAGINPKVAMLSFSTRGSAKHDAVTKVQQATARVKELAPHLEVDGELQFDAAVVPEVGQLKAPGSTVAGHANTFIFPDLQSGNIGYKIAQRLGGAEAFGPICQGFAAPINDLSRGCSTDDVVGVVAITCLQAANN